MSKNNNTEKLINKKNPLLKAVTESGLLWVVLAFVIPVVIMTLAFKEAGMHPYGDQQMLVIDLWHQYYPFFRVVREKLLLGSSFLYSWETGMGTNFLSLISYYAASPLNLLSVFASEDAVRDALMYILIAKIGFCGASFSMFLKYTFRRNDLSIAVFGTLYALCSYVLGYYWNVMWFDTIALFPLVMLGICAICREGKWKLFTITLALSLISNYYIAYFTCLFTVLAFAGGIICEAKGFKDGLKKLWIIARSSAIGVALAGFMLLPAYYGLKLTYSANNTFPQDGAFYEKWTAIFGNLYSYNNPAMKEGLPNFACGMLCVVLFGAFLVIPKIKIRAKAMSVILLAVIAVSCNYNILNYIWHGFHFTNMIPYRFAFIFSFILITSAYAAFDAMMKNGVKIYQLIAMLIGPAAVVWCSTKVHMDVVKAALNGEKNYIRRSLIIAIAFILIFVIVKIFPMKSAKIRSYATSLLLCLAVCAECYTNAVNGVKTVGNSDYKSYPLNADDVHTVLSDINANEEQLFFRTEMSKTYTLNDGALYGYNGVSQFSSSANVSVTRLMAKLGLYASEAGNRYYYRLSSPVTNALLGIKYIVSRDGMILSDPLSLDYVTTEGSVSYYKNKYSLPIGFMMDSNIMQSSAIAETVPFKYQNEIMKLACGSNEDIFTHQPVALATYDGLNVNKASYGNYTFNKTGNANNSSLTFDYNGADGSYLYGYVTPGGFDSITVNNDGNRVDGGISAKDYAITFPMGEAQSGHTASLTITAASDKPNGSGNIMVYALNKKVWDEDYAKLADEPLNLTKFSDSKMKGTITANNNGILYLSIPYDGGWKLTVDGKKTDTFAVMGGMTGARLSAGKHNIELSYVPNGLPIGAAATGGGVILFVFFAVLDVKRRKKKMSAENNADTNLTPKSDKMDDVPEIVKDVKSDDMAQSKNKEKEESKENENEKS